MKTEKEIAIKTNERDAAMDLLRIIVMLLVLVVHSNFKSIHSPISEDIISSPITSFFRFFIQSLSVCCVNVFVFISGWFGIRTHKEKLLSLIFQIVFFVIIGYAIILISNPDTDINVKQAVIDVWYSPNYWFVRSYIILYCFAPVLNMFLEKCDSRLLTNVILGTYLCQIIFGWYFHSCDWYSNGYSPLAFMGLYLLGRYLRVRPMSWATPLICFSIYIGLSLFLTLLAFVMVWGDKNDIANTLFTYNSPFVMLSSIALFLTFTKLHIVSKLINKVAISSLAIYLLHCHPALFDSYYCLYFYKSFHSSGYSIFMIKACGFLLSVFIVSILLDQLRLLLWKMSKHELHI